MPRDINDKGRSPHQHHEDQLLLTDGDGQKRQPSFRASGIFLGLTGLYARDPLPAQRLAMDALHAAPLNLKDLGL